MDDVWFAAGLGKGDLDRCLGALALAAGSRPPLIAVAGNGDRGPRLVLASLALFVLFGATDDEQLSRRLLGAGDPGARRLAALQTTLPLGGAPRLERLRFAVGPGSEIITFLCRRVRAAESGGTLFVAAALGVRAALLPRPPGVPGPADAVVETAESAPAVAAGSEATAGDRRPAEAPLPPGPLDVPSIHAALKRRWPDRRTARFLWQSDAAGRCTQISPPLAEIVGAGNADLVGADLLALAPRLDPSGRLEAALRSRETFSGVDVAWPVENASAGVAVGLGAIPAYDAERDFAGYRGYGIVRLDEVVSREPLRIATAGLLEAGSVSEPDPAANVIAFPFRTLSADDQRAFADLAAGLREEAGLPEPAPETAEAPEARIATPPLETAVERKPGIEETPATLPSHGGMSAAARAAEIARNGVALLDRLSLGLLVSRDNVPIFANRHFLDLTGFADEDALHAAGGMAHLFGGSPGNASGAEAVSVRTGAGATLAATARVQRVDWDGLPATLLTLQGGTAEPRPVAEAKPQAELRQAGAAGRDDDERRELRAILETATDGVVVMDDDCSVLSLNRAGEALFARDRGEVVGKPFLDLFAAHDRDLARDYLEGVKSDATRSLLNDGREFLVSAAQGGSIPVFMTLGRLGSARDAGVSGRPARFCALFRDLTHWKKVEGELDEARRGAERASALKSDFLAKVSHEVRTPLNAIIGFAEVILEERFGPLGNERYKDYLRDIHGSGTHVMSLVNDLLDLSKIEAGKMELAVQPIDVNRVVSECVALMQPQASRERVIVRLALAKTLPKINADERSLRQIALNILSNAVKFNEPGGQVIVATQLTEAGHVVLRVRDTGPGMSESDIAAALEPFRQLGPSRGGGTGLGLPLTKALVEANEAALTIRSKVEQGTFVEVAFPPARVLAAG